MPSPRFYLYEGQWHVVTKSYYESGDLWVAIACFTNGDEIKPADGTTSDEGCATCIPCLAQVGGNARRPE